MRRSKSTHKNTSLIRGVNDVLDNIRQQSKKRRNGRVLFTSSMDHGALGVDETGMLFSAANLRRSLRPLGNKSQSHCKYSRGRFGLCGLELLNKFGHSPGCQDLNRGVQGDESEL